MTGFSRLLVALAGLFGAAGTALAAAASHGADPRQLAIASAMLLFHAPALLALAALDPAAPRAMRFPAGALLLGVALFAGDLAARHFLGDRLFPGSAPLGGGLLVLGWLGLALAALLPRRS